MTELEKSAEKVLSYCLGVKPGETLLILEDGWEPSIAEAFDQVGVRLGAEVLRMRMLPRRAHGEEPPPPVASAMASAQVVVAPTSKSLSHTLAREKANAAGARIATLPMITQEVLLRGLSADYEALRQRSLKVAQRLTEAQKAHLITPAGTNLHLSLEGRPAFADTGFLQKPGDFGNLPAGEAYVVPVEGSAEGILVVDLAMAGIGRLSEPLRMVVQGGFVKEITGGPEAGKLLQMLEAVGPLAYNIAELGVGTNDQAIVSGNVLEDEKVLGTVHIALGNNARMGGTIDVPLHLDGVLSEPTLLLDGRPLLEKGRLLEE